MGIYKSRHIWCLFLLLPTYFLYSLLEDMAEAPVYLAEASGYLAEAPVYVAEALPDK